MSRSSNTWPSHYTDWAIYAEMKYNVRNSLTVLGERSGLYIFTITPQWFARIMNEENYIHMLIQTSVVTWDVTCFGSVRHNYTNLNRWEIKCIQRPKNKQFLEERLTRQHFSKSLYCEVKSQDIKATEVTKMKQPGEQSSTGVFQQAEEAKVTSVQARGCGHFSKG